MTQQCLFDDEVATMSLDVAARSLEVSVATIRNWIKTGYLQQTQRGTVSMDSVEAFKRDISGKEKLLARANKLQRDDHDHEGLVSRLLQQLNKSTVSAEAAAKIYEDSLSNTFRNKEGIYYTPSEIVQGFFDDLQAVTVDTRFCDPCCGSGNFLVEAARRGVYAENIYGFDKDPFAVEVAKRRVHEITGETPQNIKTLDFLEACLKPDMPKFDVIFTNPPWGAKFEKSRRESFAKLLGAGSTDTSSLFFSACLNVLADEGTLGLLLQDAFFNVAAFEKTRSTALKRKIVSVTDHGKPFHGLVTKAKSIVLINMNADGSERVICRAAGGDSYYRKQISFDGNPKKIINDSANQIDASAMQRVFQLPHITLKGRARWGLGIVTGNNKKFQRSEPEAGYVEVLAGKNIGPDGLIGKTSYIPADLSLYQQVAPLDLYRAPAKLIYKFISSSLAFHCDREQLFLLNSANFLVPDDDFPISLENLRDLLNSNFMSWLFQKLFDTHKILRRDLEELPFHVEYFKNKTKFNEPEYLDYLGLMELKGGTYGIKAADL